MEEDIKNKWKVIPNCNHFDTMYYLDKFEKDYPGLTHKLIKAYNDKIYKKDE